VELLRYIGPREAYPILIKVILHRLEYRGYDSAGGIALLNDDLHIKMQGKVSELELFVGDQGRFPGTDRNGAYPLGYPR